MPAYPRAADPYRPLPWVFDDGGRAAAGYAGETRDCVARAVAIAARLPYQQAYDLLNTAAARERPRSGRRRSSARTGVRKSTYRAVLEGLGWVWTPTMRIGAGCRVHLRDGQLPARGPLIVSVSRHPVAVVDGVVRDTSDPTRGGTRCVYGYFAPRSVTPIGYTDAVPRDEQSPPRICRDAVRAEMERRGLTIVELAEAAGVSRANLSNWLNGKREARTETVDALLDYLGLEIRRSR